MKKPHPNDDQEASVASSLDWNPDEYMEQPTSPKQNSIKQQQQQQQRKKRSSQQQQQQERQHQ
eukprot:10798176-Ditylum_brightwellii.AAC.1